MISHEVLKQALNPEALAEIISKYSGSDLIKTLVNKESRETAQYSMVRPKSITGIEYILCPVLSLFDEENSNEVGFAINVDQDHFDVYAYEHNHNNNESKVYSTLPHCVHKAVTLDGSDYSQISEDVKMTANIDSAILFINHYLADQALGFESPFEVFDNKLYQQLINRLVANGNNKKVADLRLDSLLKNYDSLDENDIMYENNLLRADAFLANFLVGCEDNIGSKGCRELIDLEKIKPYMQRLYTQLIKQGWLDSARDLMELSGVQPSEAVVQSGYDFLFKLGWLGYARDLMELSGVQP
ncbi:MAG: hypothetical protein PHT91_01585, partial [Candidatus Nanoarchaeia archaeon]|nr:hypothetical protein [Candidatus Nanoarchaeia archaeon]